MKTCQYCDHPPTLKSYDEDEEIDVCGCCAGRPELCAPDGQEKNPCA